MRNLYKHSFDALIRNVVLRLTEGPAVLLHDVEVDLGDVDAGGAVEDGAAHHQRGQHHHQELGQVCELYSVLVAVETSTPSCIVLTWTRLSRFPSRLDTAV